MTVQTLLLILIGAALFAAAVIARRRMFSFQAQRPEDFDGTDPRFDMRRHLSGPMTCEGVIYGLGGRVVSRFRADFDIAWDGSTASMKEHFLYDSGATQDREWHLELLGEGKIRAKAEDVVGTGHGQAAGCGVLMTYRLRLPQDAGGHVLDATDWMYLVNEEGAIINHSQFRKFGFKVAELIATIRPKEAI